jgi:3-oxoacyl-[acyl-carrier-protein] synthase II
VTGLGVVSAYGCGLDSFWCALTNGTPAAGRVEPSVFGVAVGAPVRGFVARDHVDVKSLRLMAPAVAFGVAAAELAVKDSGFDPATADPVRFGAFVGSRGHGTDREDLLPAVQLASSSGTFEITKFASEGLGRVNPMWLLKGLANNVLYFLALKYNAQGMNNNISLGSVGGTIAIGEAFEGIRRGYVDVALTAGYDSMLDLDRLEMFGNSGLVTAATDPSGAGRPFDRHRDGFVPGEGAAALLLESLDSARARGARIYGEVLGYGAATVPRSKGSLAPSYQGFATALTAALAQAGRQPDAVFTLGLATQSSDLDETAALKSVFGASASSIAAPALKSMTGNTLAASGSIEAVAALLALRDGVLPPTINLTDPDPACDLDYVAGTSARSAALETVALNNANLGGGHASLVFGRLS